MTARNSENSLHRIMLLILCLCVLIMADVTVTVRQKRTDITDKGYSNLFHGWVDVQGQGVKNDYCRVVGPSKGFPFKWLSCALAGTQGASEYNYNPSNGGTTWFDLGYSNTWFMEDKNGDGRDDYCRCVGNVPKTWMSCMQADRFGFNSNQYTFTIKGSQGCR